MEDAKPTNGQLPKPIVQDSMGNIVPFDSIPYEQQVHLLNQQLHAHIHNMQGQITFLENRLKEVCPSIPAPVYPSTEMPPDPVTGLPIPANAIRVNAEGHLDILPDPAKSPVLPPPAGRLRIMIGIPMLSVSYEFYESFLKFWTALCLTPNRQYEIMYHFAYRKPVHMAEEYLVKTAQHNKCTHILLMDDDIFDVTPQMLELLINAKKEFISGVMHASKFPHAMCVFRRYDPTKKVIDMPADTSMYRLYEVPATCPHCQHAQSHWDVKFCAACGKGIDITIQECDLTPFPFTLIDLKVFDKIKKPWFHCTNEYPTDSWFCDRLMEAGIKPYAHMLVRLNHAGITDETRPHFMNMGMAKMQKTKAIVQLSPEQMDIHQTLLVNRMKEVEASLKVKPPIVYKSRLVGNEPTPDLTLITVDGQK